MRLRERHLLPVPLRAAWEALNDLAVLSDALPGCESLVEIAPDEFVGEMAVPLGLVTSRFTLYIVRRDVDAPHACTLRFETRTAAASGAGEAALLLQADEAGATTLQADIGVEVDGLLGALGAPAIDLAARRMAGEFFDRLRAAALAHHARARESSEGEGPRGTELPLGGQRREERGG
ncbi:MAG: CoxG family protein [Burkholderiaceae bacterium]